MCRWRSALNYLAGLVYGDGTLYYYKQNNEYFVYVYDEDPRFLIEVGELVRSTLGVNYTIVKPSNTKNYYRLQFTSKKVYEYVQRLLRERPKRLTKNFIRGFVDAEGSIYEDRGRIVFQLASTSYTVMVRIKRWLEKKGIQATLVEYRDKRGNRKPIYKVYVRGRENVKKLMDELNPLHPKLKLKFERLYEGARGSPGGPP